MAIVAEAEGAARIEVTDEAHEHRTHALAHGVDGQEQQGRGRSPHPGLDQVLHHREDRGEVERHGEVGQEDEAHRADRCVLVEGQEVDRKGHAAAQGRRPGVPADVLLARLVGDHPTHDHAENAGGADHQAVEQPDRGDRKMEGAHEVGLGEGGHRAAAEVGADQADHQQHDRAVAGQPFADLGERGRLLRRRNPVHMTPGRLLEGQLRQEGQEQSWQAEDDEGHAPAERIGDPAADDRAQHDAERHAGGVDAEGGRPPPGLVVVRQQRMRGGAAAAFADAHAHAEDRELPEGGGDAAKRGHDRPEGDADRDDGDPALALREPGDGDAEDHVEDGEGRAGEQAELGVRQPELGDDLGADRRDDHTVEEAAGVDGDQQAEQPAEISA